MKGLDELCEHDEAIILYGGILSQDRPELEGNLVNNLGKEIVVLGLEPRECMGPITALKKVSFFIVLILKRKSQRVNESPSHVGKSTTGFVLRA